MQSFLWISKSQLVSYLLRSYFGVFPPYPSPASSCAKGAPAVWSCRQPLPILASSKPITSHHSHLFPVAVGERPCTCACKDQMNMPRVELTGGGEPDRTQRHRCLRKAAADAELFLLSSCTHHLSLWGAKQQFMPADRNTSQAHNGTTAQATA